MPEIRDLPAVEAEKILRDAKLLLRDNKLLDAINALQKILDLQPAHRDALYYLAVCLRRQGEHDRAFEVLDKLLLGHPGYGRAYQDYGHNFLALNNRSSAAENFALAVSLNPSLIASWKALASYYQKVGPKKEAEDALRRVQHLANMPPELVSVSSLLYEDKILLAEQLCRQYLQKHAHHPEAMRLLADIGSRLQIFDDAEFLLQKCVEFYPDFHHARADYVQVLHKRQKFEKALQQAKVLIATDANNIAFQVSLASSNQAVGDFDQALKIYDAILADDTRNHMVHNARGHALKTIGRTDEAIKSYRNSYRSSPSYGDAYWSLANLKTYRFSDLEVDDMRQQQGLPSTSDNDKVHLCFALGKALEDKQEFAESFEFYDKGNQLKRQASQYKIERTESDFAEQKALFNADFFSQRSGFGCPSAAPIFVVGLPRAGSTLLEQILASHSQVDGTMELANIIGLAHRLGGRGSTKQTVQYPAVLTKLSDEHCRKFGDDFISDTKVHRQSAVYFIDKMPNNFRHVALIHLILPNAKIIDARREPMACCFSGFKQLFAEGQEFTYGLESIGSYYRAYVDLMNHWDSVLPGRVLRVQHEDVIEDLEKQVRRILDYCDLPFEQSCVDFHKTERAVRTPSSEQVRQPIYKSSMQQWKNYQEFLTPLVTSLGDAKENF
ncbi:MAG: tetratricopeptide (TPR) repeat protein [Arenicella sp.]|jgi:tetratricopeptide (TPR) repeat protein